MGIRYLMEDMGAWARVVGKMITHGRPGQGIGHLGSRQREIEQRLVRQLHPPRMKLRVSEVIQESPSTRTFRFTRVDGSLPPFRPGQYINLFVQIDAVRTSRPYSISSAPRSPHLDLTVRRKEDGFVSPFLLDNLNLGDELESTGPRGTFRHEPLIDGDELVFLAGGSGITPMMSMLRDQARQGFPQSIALLYGSRSEDDIVFGAELSQMARQFDRFRYSLVISEPSAGYKGLKGFLDSHKIQQLAGDLQHKTIFLCGPQVMMDFCRQALQELGAPKVRTEAFGPPDQITSQPGWPDEVSPSRQFQVELDHGERITVQAGEPLICSLERNGVVVPAACRTGECSACRTRLLSGQIYMPPGTGVRETDQENGYIHPCMSYPISHLRIRLTRVEQEKEQP